MNKPDILCFSSSDWHGKWGSRQQVMLRFARRGYRVLFVEQLAGLEHFWKYPDLRRRRWRRWREGVQEIKPNLWLLSPPPLFPGRYYSPTIARLNAVLVRRWLAPYLRRLNIPKPILWLYQPEHAPLICRFGERLVVYHCIDKFTAGTMGHKRRTIAALEGKLLNRVDLVFANSLLTYENKRQLNSHTYRIPSGADVEHFAQALDSTTSVHPAIAAIPHPIAGFVGNVNNKLNIHLLVAVAARLSDWQFAFVGQPYPQSVDLRPLRAQPNVHFLGRFPFAEVPALVKGMDVCLLPYADTEFARYRSPLKLYEYLAAGKPIVSTDHPEVRDFVQWLEIASTPKDFAAAVLQVREDDSPEKQRRRIELSQQHSWDCRVDKMEQIVITHLGEMRGDCKIHVRVLHLITELNIGGAEKALARLLTHLDRDRFIPTVACLYGGDGPVADEIRALDIPVIDLAMTAKWRWNAFWRFYRLLCHERPTILHTWMFHANLLGRIAGRWAGVPLIISSERTMGQESRWRYRLNRLTEPLTNRVVCVSQKVADFTVEEVGIPRHKTIVIPNGIDARAFEHLHAKRKARTKLGLPLDSTLVGTVARLDPVKRLDVLLQATALMDDVHAVIIGDGPERVRLEVLSEQLGLMERVYFAGQQSNVLEWLAALDIFALSSDWEGMSNAVLEAMAAGLPVVATAVGGVPEVVVDGVTGLLVPPRDPDALARSITRLLRDPDLRREMGQAGRRRIERHFTIEQTVAQTVALYETLLREKSVSFQ